MINRKILFIILLLGLSIFSITNVYATEPWPTKVLESTEKSVIVKLQPQMKEALVISNDKTKITKIFSIEDLGLKEMPIMSTAGLIWYRNSIAFFDKQEQYLIIRLEEGETVVVELKNNTLLPGIPKDLKEETDEIVTQKASNLLDSKDAQERQTAAIICGQIKLTKAIPKLKKLLADDSSYSTKSGDSPWKTVYFVRKSAKNALEAMGENINGIIVEEIRDK